MKAAQFLNPGGMIAPEGQDPVLQSNRMGMSSDRPPYQLRPAIDELFALEPLLDAHLAKDRLHAAGKAQFRFGQAPGGFDLAGIPPEPGAEG